MTASENNKEWKKKKRAEGWKQLNMMVAPELFTFIKQAMRDWKYNHPEIYKNTR